MRKKIYNSILSKVEIKSIFSTFINISVGLYCYKYNVNVFEDQLKFFIYANTIGSVIRIILNPIISRNIDNLISKEYNFDSHKYKLDLIHDLYIYSFLILSIIIIFFKDLINIDVLKYLLLIITQILFDNTTYLAASRKFIIDNSKFHRNKLITIIVNSSFLIFTTFKLKLGFYSVFLSCLISQYISCFLYGVFPFVYSEKIYKFSFFKNIRNIHKFFNLDGFLRGFHQQSEGLLISLTAIIFNLIFKQDSSISNSLLAATNYIRSLSIALRDFVSKIEIRSIYKRNNISLKKIGIWISLITVVYFVNLNTDVFRIFLTGNSINYQNNIFNSILFWLIFFPYSIGYSTVRYLDIDKLTRTTSKLVFFYSLFISFAFICIFYLKINPIIIFGVLPISIHFSLKNK